MQRDYMKTGRPRAYDFGPIEGIRNEEAGYWVSVIEELLERVADQAEGLPQKAVDFTPQGTTLSVGRLLVHLSWAEVRMIGLALDKTADPKTAEKLAPGALDGFSAMPASLGSADELVRLMRDVRKNTVIPWCADITDIGAQVKGQSPLRTIRETFMQLSWHWVYHSGQIGLLSLQAGYDYTWTFGKK